LSAIGTTFLRTIESAVVSSHRATFYTTHIVAFAAAQLTADKMPLFSAVCAAVMCSFKSAFGTALVCAYRTAVWSAERAAFISAE
jgi:hypothetical protein